MTGHEKRQTNSTQYLISTVPDKTVLVARTQTQQPNQLEVEVLASQLI